MKLKSHFLLLPFSHLFSSSFRVKPNNQKPAEQLLNAPLFQYQDIRATLE